MKRIRQEYEEFISAANPAVKELISKKHVDEMLDELEVNGPKSTHPTLSPVIDAMIEALSSKDPLYSYLVDGSSSLFDKYCVSTDYNLI